MVAISLIMFQNFIFKIISYYHVSLEGILHFLLSLRYMDLAIRYIDACRYLDMLGCYLLLFIRNQFRFLDQYLHYIDINFRLRDLVFRYRLVFVH